MTGRDILAFLAGVGFTLAVATIGTYPDRSIVGRAVAAPPAQKELSFEQVRSVVLALANALASVAVDSERTAVAQNATADRVAELAARLADVEKRLAALEKK